MDCREPRHLSYSSPMKDKNQIYGPLPECEEYWESLPEEFYWASECPPYITDELVNWRKKVGASPEKIARLGGFEPADYLLLESGERKMNQGEAARIDEAILDYRRFHISPYYNLRLKIFFWLERRKWGWRRFRRYALEIILTILILSIPVVFILVRTFIFPGPEYAPVFLLGRLADWGSSFALPAGIGLCVVIWIVRGFRGSDK